MRSSAITGVMARQPEKTGEFNMRATNDPYFDWLCILIGVKGYTRLVSSLHEKQFHPAMELDINRGADGLQLRVEFMNEHGPWGTSSNRGPCTMLEFLVGLAKRMSFLTGGEGNHGQTGYYFWRMIDNLGLSKATDGQWDILNGEFFVEDAVWRINERQYGADGQGGIFPLRRPNVDQRTVEIWYQMNAWLIENSDVSDW